tara:strand:- start:12 stop:929 length:918 start_codon:yes stop_codon:yes gene_type:complete
LIKTIYLIAGPTASGKSQFSIDLAKKINGVVINSDSMQVYKNLKILTARPNKKEMQKIDHYLYGYVNGVERYNVEKWCNDAAKIINETFERNSNPILVGGTGLYVHTLINGLIDIPAIPESIKNKSEKIIKEFGKDFLITQIQKFDPRSLKEVNSNDTLRLRRIWEVYESTGKKFSEWKLNENKKFIENLDFKIILFLPNREKNYQIVNSRFIKMINDGAIEEVKNLLDLNLNDSLPVMRAHGVPEIIKFLRNEISLEECISKGQQVTRNYVKRQHTWWNSTNLDIFHQFDKFPIEIDINSIKID